MKNTYLKVFLILCVLIFGTIATSQAQSHLHDDSHRHVGTVKRVIVQASTPDTFRTLSTHGIDLNCGAKPVNGGVQLDLNVAELAILEDLNLTYSVEVEDLTTFVAERAERELPRAQAELSRLKSMSEGMKPIATSEIVSNMRSFSESSVSINSAIQYDECAEVDWTPQNFQFGSMGGAYNYQEVLDELDRMETLYGDIISVRLDASSSNQKTHGFAPTSIAPQTMWYVEISDNPGSNSGSEANEPQSLITGAAHAREVSSVMNIIYYMWYILENYESDPMIKNMVDNQKLYFIPVINPDGYTYNGQQAPNGGGDQRKNMLNNGTGQYSRGVDLNRNSPYYWGIDDAGSSPVASAGTYRGPSPGSEPETQIIADFVTSRDILLAVNHHSGLNSIVTSSYNGSTSAAPSGREDEFQELMQNVTHYNRYIHGSAPNTLYEANGDFNDWMLGGPAVTTNPSGGGTFTNSGSGENIIAFTPENGDEFAPDPNHIVPIAKRAVRMNLITSLAAGKYAQLHDLTRSDINSTTGETLDFAVEYVGQTLSDLTLTVTPISSNIASITPLSATALDGLAKLEQREVSLPITLNSGIQPNELIEYEVTLSNDTYDIYKATYRKYYTPTQLVNGDGIGNWTGNWISTSNGYAGSTNAITVVASGAYGNNLVRTTTLNGNQNLSGSDGYLIQFNALWDIERNFDLVQLEASTDGTNWTALCGKYNKPAASQATNNHFNNTKGGPGNPSNHQEVNGTYIYDGDQIVGGVNKWVMEEVIIDFENNTEFLGENNVNFRFRFDSDGSNLQDGYNTDFRGFTFDNFRILSLDSYAPELCTDAAVNAFPHTESFENGIGLWTQNQEDDGEWTRGDAGGTPSGTTGPNAASDGTFYLYTEATEDAQAPGENLGNNATAILTSPCFDLTAASAATFSFDYNMVGNNMGTLIAEVIDDQNFEWTPIFTQNGQPAGANQNTWISISPSLAAYVGRTIKIRFVGTTGGGFSSDMAIDNIRLEATITDNVPPTAVCQNFTTSLGADGTVTILPSQIDNGSSDDVGIASLTLDVDTFDCSNVGINDVILTVTDSGGNSDTCTATVTIDPYVTPPTGLAASAITPSTATLSWNAAASNDYTVRFRESGTTTWTENNLTTNTIDLTNLTVDTEYEAEVKANCITGDTPYSATVTFMTTPITYCDANGNSTADEYISNVTINNGTTDILDNGTAASAGGYGDFTSIVTDLEQGQTFSISVAKTWTGTLYNEAIGVWIDYNRNGDFTDAGEQIVTAPANQNTPILTSGIVVPMNATTGTTRMRVVMKYVGGGDTGLPVSCGSFAFGEVEDYTINILPSVTEYVYDAGAWSPSDPSGIATALDNITVISGTGPISADTSVNTVTVQNGATLSLGTTILSVNGNIDNSGTIEAATASIEMTGDTAQTIGGNSFDLGILTVDNAAGATITGAVEIKTLLSLTAGLLTTNGNLTLGSDINGSAMVAPITSGSISGNVITEQYIPAKRAFRLIGSTVTTSTAIRANWQENGSAAGSFGTHITGSTTGANGFDATASGNYSLFTLNNPGQAWEAVTNTDVNTLTAGQPMRLLVRGDRTIDLASNNSTATVTTLRATGQLATGTITTTGTALNHNANTFNFIGNPYQASVNVNEVMNNSTNINTNQIFVWDATMGERGQYVTVTLDGTGSSNGANSKNYHFLQPGQAIFTRTLATVGDNSTAVVFSETDKVVGQNVPVYGIQNNSMFTSAHIIGRLYRTERYGTEEGLQDNFVILFDADNDNDITPSDASKFYNIDENMAISNGNTLLSVEQRAMPQEGEEIQFFNALYRTSEYSLDIDVAGITDVTAYFVDTYLQTTTALQEGMNTLTFTVDTDNEDSAASDRFKIVYEASTLATEDSQDFDFAIFPNPITDGTVNILSSKLAGQDATVVIHNLLGQEVIKETTTFSGNILTINNLNNLQSGVYLVTVKNDNAQATQRIIVQ